jgi:hypothetical protein
MHCTVLILIKLNQNIQDEAAQRNKSLYITTNCGVVDHADTAVID